MTFTKDATISDFRIDFLLHGYQKQIDLLNDFVGRGLHDQKSGPIHRDYLQPDIYSSLYGIAYSRRAYYHASIFLFGFKRGDRMIKPSISYFKDNYFDKALLESSENYRVALEKFLFSSFSKYIVLDNNGKNPILNKMNIDGKKEIFNFLLSKLETVLEKISLPHEGCKEILINALIRQTFYPTGHHSNVRILRNILFTGKNDVITFTISGLTIRLEISYSELMEVLTPDMLYTMNFLHYTTKGSYLDFDLVWKNLAHKVQSAHSILIRMLDKVPKSDSLKVEFYSRRPEGISKGFPITDKSQYLTTSFRTKEMIINLRIKKILVLKLSVCFSG